MKIKYIIPFLFAAIFLVSCEEQGGLFYSIEQESAIRNGKLADDITIGAFARNNDYYFIAAGKFLYKAADSDTDWPGENVNLNPEGYGDYLCYNFTLVGDSLYSVFYDWDTVDYKLFIADTSNPSSGVSWSDPFSFANVPGAEKIIAVKNIQNRFFIYTETADYKYSLYSTATTGLSSTSSFEVIQSGMSAGGEPSIDFDGTNFWIAAGNKVLRSNAANTLTSDVTNDVMSKSDNLFGEGFSGILCADTDGDSTEEVYLTSEEGVMLKYIDSVWEVIPNQYDETNGLFSPLNGLMHIEINNANDDVDIIVAGSEYGYYEMEASKDITDKQFILPTEIDSNLTIKNQFESIDLSSNIIKGFYFDDTAGNEIIFALCYNGGLWINSLKNNDGSYYRFWDIE